MSNEPRKNFDDLSLYTDEMAFEYARRAMPLMAKHGVVPTPKNYAIWYMYVSEGNPALNHEIDVIIREEMEFSPDICEYLHSKYVAESESQVVIETTKNMRDIMASVIGTLNEFRGETTTYQKDLSGSLEGLQTLEQQEVRRVAETVAQRVLEMVQSSSQVHDRLDSNREEIDKLKQKLAQVTIEAERDFLTGVFNRKALDKRLGEMTQLASKEGEPLCMVMIDIDHFKAYNDQYGHLIGDEVLKIVSKVLTNMVKGQDIVARFGGEEFVILLPNTPIQGATIVAETIRRTIGQKELRRKDTGDKCGHITASLGIACYRPMNDTIPTFIKRADEALYRAKQAGRNCTKTEEEAKNLAQ